MGDGGKALSLSNSEGEKYFTGPMQLWGIGEGGDDDVLFVGQIISCEDGGRKKKLIRLKFQFGECLRTLGGGKFQAFPVKVCSWFLAGWTYYNYSYVCKYPAVEKKIFLFSNFTTTFTV